MLQPAQREQKRPTESSQPSPLPKPDRDCEASNEYTSDSAADLEESLNRIHVENHHLNQASMDVNRLAQQRLTTSNADEGSADYHAQTQESRHRDTLPDSIMVAEGAPQTLTADYRRLPSRD